MNRSATDIFTPIFEKTGVMMKGVTITLSQYCLLINFDSRTLHWVSGNVARQGYLSI